jgi:hypothetical protein
LATRYYRGAGANVRQTKTITVANTWAAADTATVTVDSVSFVITIGTLVTTTQVATTIFQALTGTTFTDTTAACTISAADGGATAIPQMGVYEFNATNPSAGIVLLTGGPATASPAWLAGKPFTLADGDIGTTAGNGTATVAAVVTATSQAHWDNQDNWSANTIPVDGDTVVFDSGNIDLLYNLTTAIQPAQITKYKAYTGNVGLAAINTDNTSKPYSEYRTPRYWTTDDDAGTAATVADLEVGEGTGSSRFMWDSGAGEVTINIFGKGQRVNNIPCILWKGTAATLVNNLNGDFAAAYFAGEAATITTVRSGNGPQSGASTILSSGVTVTNVIMNGGYLSTSSAIAAATQYGGTWEHNTGTVTAATVNGGTAYPLGGATWTTLTLASGGKFDTTRGTATFAITNTIQMYKGSSFIDPGGRAGNVVVKLNNCTLADVTIVLAPNKTYTLS